MNPEKWQKAKALFHAALEYEPAMRQDFLAHSCAGDEELRKEVETLLQSFENAQSFIETPELSAAFQIIQNVQLQSLIGQRLGPYELVRELGQGGMGAVFLASRADDQYKKQVAIKLVKQGANNQFIIQRFLSERQILANLDHPNIARLLDGGATEDGSPYLVMEYVEGVPIDRYADDHTLSIRERLKIFRTVCSAVHYAHRNLVIHRDIKPGNILVTEQGDPKLLDFGIAKLLSPAEAGMGETGSQIHLMTPAYASPEQVRGDTITTASDIYTLGVVLYEILTGHRPYEVNVTSAPELLKIICEDEPPRPSTVINLTQTGKRKTSETEITPETVSKVRNTQPKKLRQELFGDLDNIVMKAMRKEPELRYSSVEEFSEDLRRYLEGLPVLASKDTFSYRAGKFIRRHKAGMAAAVIFALMVITGSIAVWRETRIARAERSKAEQHFNDVRELANWFLFDFDKEMDRLPGSTPGRVLLVQRALTYLDTLANDSRNDLSLLRELAAAYQKVGDIQGNPNFQNIGDTTGALESYRKALAIRQSLAAKDPGNSDVKLEIAQNYDLIADMLSMTNDIDGTMDSLQKASQFIEAVPKESVNTGKYVRALAILHERRGEALMVKGEVAEALDNFRNASRIREKVVEQNPEDNESKRALAQVLSRLGSLRAYTNKDFTALQSREEAIEICRRSLELYTFLAAADPSNAKAQRDLAVGYNRFGDLLWKVGDVNGELENYQKSLQITETLFAADPQNVQLKQDLALHSANVGYAQAQTGNAEEAIKNYQSAAKLFEEIAAADPTNLFFRENQILYYGYFGDVYAMLAENSKTGKDTRREWWQQARSWYQHSLDLLRDLQNRHQLRASLSASPEEMSRNIARCDAEIAKLK